MLRTRGSGADSLQSALRTQWQTLDPAVRIACPFLLLLAAVLLTLGVTGDVQGWWDDYSFLTNVLSSLTGVCVGIPFALLVIGSVAARQTTVTVAQEARRYGAYAAEQLREAARPFVVADAGERIVGPVVQMAEVVGRFRVQLERIGADPGGLASEDARSAVRRTLRELAEGIERVRGVVLAALPSSILENESRWAHLAGTWRYIDGAIRPAFLRADLPWLDQRTQAALQTHLAGRESPVTFLLELRDVHAPEYAAECLRILREEGPPDLTRLTSLHLHHVDQDDVLERGLESLRVLEGIRESVDAAVQHLSEIDRGRP